MGQMINEAAAGGSVKKGSAAPVVIALALTAAIMAGAYAGLCYWAGSRTTFYPKETISGVNVGGLTVEQAGQVLAGSLPGRALTVSPVQTAEAEGWLPEAAGASITLGELGYTAEQCPGIAQRHFDEQAAAPFLSRGARVLSILTDSEGDGLTAQDRDEEIFREGVARLAEELAMEPVDGSFTVLDDEILLTKEANGRSVGEEGLALVLESAAASGETEVQVDMTTHPAQPLSIQTVHEAVSGEMENARYDKETGGILPEKRGASFETGSAQRLLTAAAPGETVAVPADIREPEITAEELKAVLFRDLLGECTTHVGGTAARVSNVKLASAAFDGTVLNSGDLFSYNETVGQRTEAKGYKAAPAYVQGETVDEIGGGVCQIATTLYNAALLAELEITQRQNHSMTVGYVKPSQDAAIAGTFKDIKVTNPYSTPIYIEGYTKGRTLTFTIYGLEIRPQNRQIRFESETLSTVNPGNPKEVLNPALPPGTRKQVQSAHRGLKSRLWKIVTIDGVETERQLLSTDTYNASPAIVQVGPAVHVPLPQVPQVTVPVLPVPETLPALPQETPAAQPGAAQESTATPFAGIPVPTVPVIPQIPGSGME